MKRKSDKQRIAALEKQVAELADMIAMMQRGQYAMPPAVLGQPIQIKLPAQIHVTVNEPPPAPRIPAPLRISYDRYLTGCAPGLSLNTQSIRIGG